MSYDVVVAGASFAGLTLATRIKGKVLLIDRKSVGSVQTSACATFYEVLKKMDCESSLLKVLSTVNWQTSRGSYIFRAVQPFCTFDYEEFCRSLFARFGGEFLRASVKGYEDGSVITDQGTFSAKAVVDCTGWRAVLASSVEPGFADGGSLFFGIETVTSYQDSSMHFIMDRSIIEDGYAWIFPIEQGSRVGLGSLAAHKHEVASKLKEFVSRLNVEMGKSNGGFIPFKPRRAVVGKMFLVGDSAGQALPLTLEGIRQSIYFAQECADIVQNVVDGSISVEGGLASYQVFVERHSGLYSHFLRTQNRVLSMSPRRLDLVSKLSCGKWPISWFQRKYFDCLEVRAQ